MPPTVSTGEIVVRLAKVVELVLASRGLTLNQYRALTLIGAGAPPMREFAIRLATEQPNASALIDGLVGRGLVRRSRDPGDRRRVVLRLASPGHSLLAKTEEQIARALTHLASRDLARATELVAGIDAWQVALDAVAVELAAELTGRGTGSETAVHPPHRPSRRMETGERRTRGPATTNSPRRGVRSSISAVVMKGR